MSDQKYYTRFSLAQRIEHLLLFLSFTLLGITGLIQKFIDADISLWLIQAMGGLVAVRVIHRVAAVVFLLETIYHIVLLGYFVYVKKAEMTMLPGIQDAKDGIKSVGYNLGLSKTRPKMGRYTFDEKLEYWAMIWGGLVMAITGFMLWNPIVTARILPGVIIPAAKAAHGAEAVLAVLAILIWHTYHVHFKLFNKSMINGKLEMHHMEEDHPLELEKFLAAEEKPVDPKIKKRKTIFYPIAAVFSIAMLAGVYYFVTAETTAIETLPPGERVPVIEVIEPTALPTRETVEEEAAAQQSEPGPVSAALAWEGQAGSIIKEKCGLCHGTAGGYSVADLASTLKGGSSGPGVTPGDPEASTLYTIQVAGGHPGQFSTEELAVIEEWIKAGAPEK